MARGTTIDPIGILEKEYSVKDTDELPLRALVAMATYCANTKNVNLSLKKVAEIIAYLLVIEAQAEGRDIDLDATLASFNALVKDTLIRLREQQDMSMLLH